MQLIRTALAGLVALGITFALFYVMQMLISMGGGDSQNAFDGPSIEFVRLKRDSDILTRKRELPKKEKPPEAPPPPELQMSQTDAPTGDTLAIAAPSVDVNPDIGGDISLGMRATDAERVPIVRVQPQYPMRAQDRGLEGWVYVEFTITTNGSVRDPVVLDAEPPRVFDRAAIRAVRKWKYRPEIVDGVAVEVKNRTKVVFEMEKE
jgi:protein TonB